MNMNDLMSQFQQMKEQMEQKKSELDDLRIEGEAGGGMVKATVTGNRRLISLSIDPEARNDNDAEMMEDLICAAVNNAMDNAEAKAQEHLKGAAQGMMPGGLDLSKFGL